MMNRSMVTTDVALFWSTDLPGLRHLKGALSRTVSASPSLDYGVSERWMRGSTRIGRNPRARRAEGSLVEPPALACGLDFYNRPIGSDNDGSVPIRAHDDGAVG